MTDIKMADVGGKPVTERMAKAACRVVLSVETIAMVKRNEIPKGDVVSAAKIAGIMAAKKTSELIPLCHPLEITNVDVQVAPQGDFIEIISVVRSFSKTGVEMEALTAAAVAALTIYDMCKPLDKEIIISDLMLLEKTGGKSGYYKVKSKTINDEIRSPNDE